jgi:hypothetical protein
MKILFPVISIALFILSCNNSTEPVPEAPVAKKDTVAKQVFFPVTAFIKGEIFNLKADGINPKKYTTINDHTDSVWLKVQEFDAAFNEFLDPVIDSTNLLSLFTEKSFMDQTINAFTFTYDPTDPPLPDSIQLQHWDVYIDPESEKVKRVYMVKHLGDNKIQQLTWLSGKWCKVTSIVTDNAGASKIEKEVKISWDF